MIAAAAVRLGSKPRELKTDGPALLRRRHGMKPTRERGVPPAQVLAQPRPSSPPGSTGNGARTLLRPSPCRSRRQGGRVAASQGYISGTQRGSMRAKRPRSRVAPPPITLAPQGGTRRLAGSQPVPMRQSRHAWWPFVHHSFSFVFCNLFQASGAPAPTTGQFIRVRNKLCFKKNAAKSRGFNRFHGLRRPGRQGCFRQVRPPPATTGGSFEGETGVVSDKPCPRPPRRADHT